MHQFLSIFKCSLLCETPTKRCFVTCNLIRFSFCLNKNICFICRASQDDFLSRVIATPDTLIHPYLIEFDLCLRDIWHHFLPRAHFWARIDLDPATFTSSVQVFQAVVGPRSYIFTDIVQDLSCCFGRHMWWLAPVRRLWKWPCNRKGWIIKNWLFQKMWRKCTITSESIQIVLHRFDRLDLLEGEFPLALRLRDQVASDFDIELAVVVHEFLDHFRDIDLLLSYPWTIFIRQSKLRSYSGHRGCWYTTKGELSWEVGVPSEFVRYISVPVSTALPRHVNEPRGKILQCSLQHSFLRTINSV